MHSSEAVDARRYGRAGRYASRFAGHDHGWAADTGKRAMKMSLPAAQSLQVLRSIDSSAARLSTGPVDNSPTCEFSMVEAGTSGVGRSAKTSPLGTSGNPAFQRFPVLPLPLSLSPGRGWAVVPSAWAAYHVSGADWMVRWDSRSRGGKVGFGRLRTRPGEQHHRHRRTPVPSRTATVCLSSGFHNSACWRSPHAGDGR